MSGILRCRQTLEFLSMVSYWLHRGHALNNEPQARTVTPAFITAEAADGNRCPTRKSGEKLDGLPCFSAF
jgi:hypothetical protein